MKKTIGLLSLGLLFSACLHDSDKIPFDPAVYAPDFGPGDNRVMLRRLTVFDGDSARNAYGIQKIEFEKDTVFNGNAGRILAITSWDFFADSTEVYHGRRLIVREGDSLHEYVFKGGRAPDLAGLLKSSAFDTAVFSDRMLHTLFPFAKGDRWSFRAEGNPWGYDVLEKQYQGEHLCQFENDTYECGIFTFTRPGGGRPVGVIYVTRIGVLRASMDYGIIPAHGEDSSPPGFEMFEEQDLLKLNADDPTIEALKLEYKAKSTLKISH
jgi:hypothetical protein